MTERKTLRRQFSWFMLRSTRIGWPATVEIEIRKMLELMPDPASIEITLVKEGDRDT